MSETLKTYVALVLDKSGSMDKIRSEAIDNFNEQLQVLKEESSSPAAVAKKLLQEQNAVGVETRVTMTTFNQSVDILFVDKDVMGVDEITEADYVPDGMTAMYDGMGKTIDALLELPDISDDNVSILFITITDGRENSSTVVKREQLQSKIEDLQATGRWTFTYLGANQDVLEQAVENLSMSVGNTMSFSATSAGTKRMSEVQTGALKAFYSQRRLGKTQVDNFYSDVDVIDEVGDKINKGKIDKDLNKFLLKDSKKKSNKWESK